VFDLMYKKVLPYIVMMVPLCPPPYARSISESQVMYQMLVGYNSVPPFHNICLVPRL
jgi:hypothetical protein